MIPLTALLGVVQYTVADLCASDPPDAPTFTPTEIANLFVELATGVTVDTVARDKYVAALKIAAWHLVCQCNSAPTPVLPTIPLPPGDPGNPGGGTTSPTGCADRTSSYDMHSYTFSQPSLSSPADTLHLYLNLTPLLFPNEPQVDVSYVFSAGEEPLPVPMTAVDMGTSPPISAAMWMDGEQTVANDHRAFTYGFAWDVNKQLLGGSYHWINLWDGTSSGTPNPFVATLPAGTRYVSFLGGQAVTPPGLSGPPGVPRRCNIRVQMTCAGTGPFNSPCCPPDTVAQSYLDHILALEHVIIGLLGTQLHGLVDGTRHTGLAGGGSLTFVDNAKAVRVEITDLPAGWPQVAQVPPYLWSAGFVTPLAEDVPMRGQRLIYEKQTFPLLPQATGLAWQLPPQLIVDIVELLQGP